MRRSQHWYLFVTNRGMVLILPCLDFYVILYTQVSYSYSSVLRVLLSILVLLVWSVTYHPTSVSGNKYHVCTLPTSPRIYRPPHVDHHVHAS